MINFYDTSAILDDVLVLNNDNIYLSNITLKEIENIKTSKSRDEKIKFKARKAINLINKQLDKINIVIYDKLWDSKLTEFTCLSDNNDSRIIITALFLQLSDNDVIFHTADLNCKCLAFACGLQVNYKIQTKNIYTGWEIFKFDSDEELANFYQNIDQFANCLFNNQYLMIKDKSGNIIDKYKRVDDKLVSVAYKDIKTKQFGTIKPKDVYQELAIDSLISNQITLLGGFAGTGKTFLGLAYLFQLLEKGKIDKIIFFVNPVGVRDACQLGFYPGTVEEKLLSTQVGHILASKLGDMQEVERLMFERKIEIIPVVDARGYEVPENSAVYIIEAQNLTSDLLRLLLQRVKDDTKVIVDGDRLEQLDKDSYSNDNGMTRLSETFAGSDLYGQVDLQVIYRSKLASLAEKMK